MERNFVGFIVYVYVIAVAVAVAVAVVAFRHYRVALFPAAALTTLLSIRICSAQKLIHYLLLRHSK